ncbi:MAG TPA: potassium channel family protein [Bryobacteraceae bacterium]|nr:potassium channel family protein [Bryobacteraceae bacterium]
MHALSIAAILVTATLILQSIGMALLISWGRTRFPHVKRIGRVRGTLLMLRITGMLLVLHVLEILLWSGFYRWRCFQSWESAFYFSAASYSTVGYGDLVLPARWRILGPLESITGVLMCGLSASFLFAAVTRLVQHEEQYEIDSGELHSTMGEPPRSGIFRGD